LKHQANSAQQEKFVSDGEICNVILASKPAQPKIINDAKIGVKETWNSLLMGCLFCQSCMGCFTAFVMGFWIIKKTQIDNVFFSFGIHLIDKLE
jgi:hypothetical protein